MKTQQINKNKLQVGSKLDVYYGNGSYNCQATVTKVSESSCYLSNCGGHRESWNTVNTNIEKGIYKIV